MNRNHTALAIAAIFAIIASAFAPTMPVHAQDPDFSITSTPVGRCIAIGETASYTVTVSSLSGFQGNVQLYDNIEPNVTNAPTLSPIPSSASLTADHNMQFSLTASTTPSTPNQVYTITVYGLAGILVHSATVYLSFQPLCGAAGATVEHSSLFSIVSLYATIAVILGLSAATGILVYSRQRKPE